jgi:hypothetical protein
MKNKSEAKLNTRSQYLPRLTVIFHMLDPKKKLVFDCHLWAVVEWCAANYVIIT